MKKNIELYIVISIVVFIVLIAVYGSLRPEREYSVTVDGAVFEVEVSESAIMQQVGMSKYDDIEDNQGMLFVYDKPARWSFWMQGMKFDLDYVWILDSRVVQVTENVPAPLNNYGEVVTITPDYPVNRILELKAGAVNQYGIEVGDRVRF